ncbi:hypothetical protein [Micromonospora haikouensis]|uniref:hypothetical protein n=1 Tax=Micromonospora haikouensis TaxID=686309 RepID=UPI003D763082
MNPPLADHRTTWSRIRLAAAVLCVVTAGINPLPGTRPVLIGAAMVILSIDQFLIRYDTLPALAWLPLPALTWIYASSLTFMYVVAFVVLHYTGRHGLGWLTAAGAAVAVAGGFYTSRKAQRAAHQPPENRS